MNKDEVRVIMATAVSEGILAIKTINGKKYWHISETEIKP